MQPITKAVLRSLIDLQKRSVRTEERRFIIEGEKLYAEAKDSGWKLELIGVTEKFLSGHPEYSSLNASSYQLSDAEMARVSTASTPPGLIAVVAMPEYTTEQLMGARRIAAFVGINDPGNLGTMIRTADWFGIEAVLLSVDSVDVYNEKVVRAAMGSLFHIPVYQVHSLPDELRRLQSSGIRLIAAEAHGGKSAPIVEPFCIIMGSESHGIPNDISALADAVYTISGKGHAESLNVAVSFGIIASTLPNE